MSILFASTKWLEYKKHFKNAFKKNKLNFSEITTDIKTDISQVEFIIYDPNSKLKDFSPFINTLAVLNLWAGVDDLIKNETLNLPIIRLVDDGMQQGMVEWCLAHVLRHHLNTDTHIKNQDGVWRSNIIPPLSSEITIGVLGLGSLGSAVAQSLAAVGFKVLGWSQTKKSMPNIKSLTGWNSLAKVLQSSQILITLLPLTSETKYILNATTLSLLPQKCIIINPGRGDLINDSHLLSLLNSGHISHATLDVFSEEPLDPNHFYWSHPNVTVTPHIAAHTRPNSSAQTISQSIVKIRRGEIPVGLVDRIKMY